MTSFVYPWANETPAQRKAFLEYYAAVLTREANARPHQNCEWMRDGAQRALREAADIDTSPAQRDLFGAAQ